ncbi:phytoene desaturase family protein [Sanyastnella coralliicola]|uniref:phytoene desaturase family protein n=1 Tax=Sanyastnella coralliicola TaxID=3069118 RepID=UPI0027B8C00B|nr:phytoene desaturase family protein [Longitalea sp. SCSIO 12813]
MTSKIAVIGSGFAGLAAATSLADKGHQVTVFEKNSSPGGRARHFTSGDFHFDMGPSWYWMPDVFEDYFARFGKKVSDYYTLKRLDPSYRVYFEDGPVDIPADFDELKALFESIEPGSGKQLEIFMDEAKTKYEIGMSKFVFKPSHTIMEFAELNIARDAMKLNLFKSFSAYARKHFSHPKLLQLLEFPVLFLGAKPEKTPALYSLMNYADSKLGTWYPMGGMSEIVKGMVALAEEKGVEFKYDANVETLVIRERAIKAVVVNGYEIECDAVVGAADYHHIDQNIVPKGFRQYDEKYWDKRTMSPSSLLYYLAVDKKVSGLLHHNLFFDTDFGKHAEAIYDTLEWPDNPLFYVCTPSKTDPSVAPEGKENVFILMPVAPGIKENDDTRDFYYELIMDRLEAHLGMDIRKHVTFKRSYAHKEFQHDYNAFKGNAYGLANTLDQTAFLKPKLKSKKIKNLYYAGQLTTPGPGVPPSLISGQVAADELNKLLPKAVAMSV